MQPIAGLFFLSTSLELLSVKVALTLGREELQFNSVVEASASAWAATSASAPLRSFGYRILCLQASVLVGCDDPSLDDCCPTFRDSSVVSFSRVVIFILLSLKTKCCVSKSRAKITYCRIATSKRKISTAPLQACHELIFTFILRYYFVIS